MANDNHASYAKIGFTVIVGILAIVGSLIYFGGIRGRNNETFAETFFAGGVPGLCVGSDVNFRGVKVGEVRDISFVACEYDDVAEKDEQSVWVLMSLNSDRCRLSSDDSPEEVLDYLLGRGLRATVESSGITGIAHVQLDFPKAELAPVVPSWVPKHIFIPPAPSMRENIVDSASRLMRQINGMDFRSTWSNVAQIAASSAQLTENVNGAVERHRQTVDGILQNVEETTSSLRELSQMLRENPSMLLRPNDPEPLPETER